MRIKKRNIAFIFLIIYLWFPPKTNAMATSINKLVNLSFFQLSTNQVEETPDDIKQISDVFEKLPVKYESVNVWDGTVSIYGKIEKRGNVYLGSLVKNQKVNIPPSCDDNNVIEVLPLGNKKGLGYATCFLYDPNYRIIMIESTSGSVGISVLCDFLENNFTIPSLDPGVVINPIDYARYLKFGIFTKFQVKIAKLENGTIFNSSNKTIGQITKVSDKTNTQIFECTMSVGNRHEGLVKSVIRRMVDGFLQYKNTSELKTLKISGRDTEDGRSETIDFIKQRFKDSFSVPTERLISSFDIPDHFTKMIQVYNKHKGSLGVYKVKR